MPPALDTVTATGTAITATISAATIASGDSFTIKNAPLTSNVWLLQAWIDSQVAGVLRIRSPKLHDNVDAIRTRHQIGVLKPLLPFGAPVKLYPQDTEIVEFSGSAVAGDIESIVQLIYYEDLPGQQARLQTWDQVREDQDHPRRAPGDHPRLDGRLQRRARHQRRRRPPAGEHRLRRARHDHRHGGRGDLPARPRHRQPARVGARRTGPLGGRAWWFRLLSMHYNLPLIPIINSANKGATLIDCVNDENGGTANVTIWLAQLQ
jgi:hypothetical protein